MAKNRWGAGALGALLLTLASSVMAQAGNGVGTPFELAFWQSVSGSDDPALYDAYLQQYPTGTFAGLARAKLVGLRKTQATPPSAPAMPPASIVAPVAIVGPAKAPVPVAPPPVVRAPLAPPPAPPPAITPAPGAATVSKAEAASDLALLAALAKSQEVGGSTAVVVAAQGFALPARPQLDELAELPLPTSFCSAEERNAFHENRYKPVLAQAKANNDAALAHMEKLQAAYDGYKQTHDVTPMNSLAAESSDYQQQVARPAYDRQIALVRQFDAIMAVPIAVCAVPGASK